MLGTAVTALPHILGRHSLVTVHLLELARTIIILLFIFIVGLPHHRGVPNALLLLRTLQI